MKAFPRAFLYHPLYASVRSSDTQRRTKLMNGVKTIRIGLWILGTLLVFALPTFAQAPIPKALREKPRRFT